MQYNRVNNLLGWLCFGVAAITYILTLEPSVSFWDCGEFISCAYRLQISHQPGYPMFAMICKAFSLLSMGNNAKVPYFTNMGCALASAAAVMFLFWSITMLTRKTLLEKSESPAGSKLIITMGSGLVGALAFAFSDTFWFSAVETIVFAQSMLCTALVIWAILKWDANADEPGADKWIVFIAYIIGLSIGIHLLNLLTIPALTLVYYFRKSDRATAINGLLAFITGVIILVFVQYGIVQYTVKLAAYADLLFVNRFHLGFGTGAIAFLALLALLIIAGIIFSYRKKLQVLNLVLICVAFIYLGYSSFAYVPIRAKAGVNINNSDPDNAFTLASYLNREQYTPAPLLYGPYFDGKYTATKRGAALYRKGDKQYEISGYKNTYLYDHNTYLPRIYSTDPNDADFYREWLQMGDKQVPNFLDNLKFMFSWQIYQMYFRYFLWNFVGRFSQADGQSSTAAIDGNWTSGIMNGSSHMPAYIVKTNTYTPLFALPLILGIIGMLYHFSYKKRDALVIAILWFFMGIAIVLYVNQPSIQPRERDYSYVGSFYAFAIWVGLGVAGLAELIKDRLKPKTAAILATAVCLLLAPVVMACEEWGGHDRSTKMTPHDMAYNYLISCPPNAILFTYGDNDTYSLWYDQEVEGIRPDVRIVITSLFSSDWNIRQLQGWTNKSAPLPITMKFDQYKDGIRDYLSYEADSTQKPMYVGDALNFLLSDDTTKMVTYTNGKKENYLPTKNFKLKVDEAALLETGQVTKDEAAKLDTTINFKYTSNYIGKDNLALLDILAHNDWKRPICFTITSGQEGMIGLQPYLYKEGFTYRLIPFKRDTSVHDQLSKTHNLAIYDNVVNKYKWGKLKTAKYLDQESLMMFYPAITSTFTDLIHGLIGDNRPELALNALHKYDEVIPDLYPYTDIVSRKITFISDAYQLKDKPLAGKMINGVTNYLAQLLDYQYYCLKTKDNQLSPGDIKTGVYTIGKMFNLAKANGDEALSNQLNARLKIYNKEFEPVLGKNSAKAD